MKVSRLDGAKVWSKSTGFRESLRYRQLTVSSMQIFLSQDFVAATSVTWLCDQNHRTVRSGSLTSRLRTTACILGEDAAHEEQREEAVSVARREIRSALDALFLPDSVAVIGATERTGTVGRTVLAQVTPRATRWFDENPPVERQSVSAGAANNRMLDGLQQRELVKTEEQMTVRYGVSLPAQISIRSLSTLTTLDYQLFSVYAIMKVETIFFSLADPLS